MHCPSGQLSIVRVLAKPKRFSRGYSLASSTNASMRLIARSQYSMLCSDSSMVVRLSLRHGQCPPPVPDDSRSLMALWPLTG